MHALTASTDWVHAPALDVLDICSALHAVRRVTTILKTYLAHEDDDGENAALSWAAHSGGPGGFLVPADLCKLADSLETEVRKVTARNDDHEETITYNTEATVEGKLYSAWARPAEGDRVLGFLDDHKAVSLQNHNANKIVYRTRPAEDGYFYCCDLDTVSAGDFEAILKSVEES